MVDLGVLIARGYFARELPPPFTTTPLAGLVAANLGALPKAFNLDAKPPFIAQMAIHNLAAPGSLRRRLGIPNPVSYCQLASLVVKNWNTIVAHCQQSPLSLTCPGPDPSGQRAVDRKTSLGRMKK